MKNTNPYPEFSVSMSVYKNDDPTFFYEAVQSVLNQTVMPQEVIIVIDGYIPDETETILQDFKKAHDIIKIVRLEKNMGHGHARNIGLRNSKHDYVALMDSDDICRNNRFELQLNYFAANPDTSIVGGTIEEFLMVPENKLLKRKLPSTDTDIKNYMKYRCPFNQMTVMFKKKDVLEAGGYLDWFCNEDYYLWVRMAEKKFTFHNLEEVLVDVRVNENFYDRRGGYKYFKSEAKLQKLMYSKGIISLPVLVWNILIRFAVQVIMPNRLREYFFMKFTRSK
ncbi:MAG: glycosyltransferase [Bacteroidota bacterium]